VQPVQLSLAAEQIPAPPPAVLEHLPEQQLAAVVMLLAGLIARATGPWAAAGGLGDGDD
jgi:hypothetical protein